MHNSGFAKRRLCWLSRRRGLVILMLCGAKRVARQLSLFEICECFVHVYYKSFFPCQYVHPQYTVQPALPSCFIMVTRTYTSVLPPSLLPTCPTIVTKVPRLWRGCFDKMLHPTHSDTDACFASGLLCCAVLSMCAQSVHYYLAKGCVWTHVRVCQ